MIWRISSNDAYGFEGRETPKNFLMTRRVWKWSIATDSNSSQCTALTGGRGRPFKNGMQAPPVVSVQGGWERQGDRTLQWDENRQFWALLGTKYGGLCAVLIKNVIWCNASVCTFIHSLNILKTPMCQQLSQVLDTAWMRSLL